MNRQPRDMTTNAAEGLPRWRFTVAELEAVTAAGILAEGERIELIGGGRSSRSRPKTISTKF